MIKAFAVVSSLSCENRYCFDGDWASTGPPPSLGPPSPSRRLAGVRVAAAVVLDRIGVAGIVSSSSKSTTVLDVDTAKYLNI